MYIQLNVWLLNCQKTYNLFLSNEYIPVLAQLRLPKLFIYYGRILGIGHSWDIFFLHYLKSEIETQNVTKPLNNLGKPERCHKFSKLMTGQLISRIVWVAACWSGSVAYNLVFFSRPQTGWPSAKHLERTSLWVCGWQYKLRCEQHYSHQNRAMLPQLQTLAHQWSERTLKKPSGIKIGLLRSTQKQVKVKIRYSKKWIQEVRKKLESTPQRNNIRCGQGLRRSQPLSTERIGQIEA